MMLYLAGMFLPFFLNNEYTLMPWLMQDGLQFFLVFYVSCWIQTYMYSYAI